jgi:hypothetical protein
MRNLVRPMGIRPSQELGSLQRGITMLLKGLAPVGNEANTPDAPDRGNEVEQPDSLLVHALPFEQTVKGNSRDKQRGVRHQLPQHGFHILHHASPIVLLGRIRNDLVPDGIAKHDKRPERQSHDDRISDEHPAPVAIGTVAAEDAEDEGEVVDQDGGGGLQCNVSTVPPTWQFREKAVGIQQSTAPQKWSWQYYRRGHLR